MKANELMVGDWVFLFDETPVKVDCIGNAEVYLTEPKGQHELDWNVTYEHIKPIPLTPEILEKNGFRDIDKGENCDGFDIYWRNGNDGYSINMQDLHLHYVHELQHALRLCGISKEIEL